MYLYVEGRAEVITYLKYHDKLCKFPVSEMAAE